MVNEGSDAVQEAGSQHYQRALDLEALGMMGIAPEDKYRGEVEVVFLDSRCPCFEVQAISPSPCRTMRGPARAGLLPHFLS